MAISQIVWSLDDQCPLADSELNSESELEDLLHAHIELLNPNWLVIGRQVTMPSGKRIDLLCMDQDGDLIVVELKKELTLGKSLLRLLIMQHRYLHSIRLW